MFIFWKELKDEKSWGRSGVCMIKSCFISFYNNSTIFNTANNNIKTKYLANIVCIITTCSRFRSKKKKNGYTFSNWLKCGQ